MGGDSRQVASFVNEEVRCPIEVEVIVEVIKRLAQQLGRRRFQFIRRWANTVANKLANYGLRGFGLKTWKAKPPN